MTEFYHSNARQVVEVRRDGGKTRSGSPLSEPTLATTLREQYIWSPRYVNAPILRDRDNAAGGDLGKSGSGLDERLYYLTDANMNVTTLADTNGDAVERYTFDPYGKVTIYDGTWTNTRNSSSYDNSILYCGYYRDNETGLYHVDNRTYHPLFGRWMQRDPLGYVDGMSLYEYVGGNPLDRMDPDGQLWSWVSSAVGAAIGATVGVAVEVVTCAVTGQELTAGRLAGAAAGGAVAGAIIGAAAGAVTGDPTALITAGIVTGSVAGGLGAATQSVVEQAVDRGSVDYNQALDSMGRGMVVGAATGGVATAAGIVVSKARAAIQQGARQAAANSTDVTVSANRAENAMARSNPPVGPREPPTGGSGSVNAPPPPRPEPQTKTPSVNKAGETAETVKECPRLPPKGTPERNAIEAARKQGIDLKKQQELSNIRAGGQGSGNWSKTELEQIRTTGEFPKDAQWHHDPTVANRPDLAADPSSVKIIRGGRDAHLEQGHEGDWQKPK